MNISLSDFKQIIIEFFEWWFETLKTLIPKKWLRFLVSTKQPELFIRFANFQIYFYVYEQNQQTELARFYFHQEGKKECELFFNNNPQWMSAKKILLLHSKQALKKTFSLPVAVQENLYQVIGYEMERYTPFNAEQLYYSIQIVNRRVEHHQLDVELIFLTKKKLHRYYQDLQNWGILVDVVRYDDMENAYPYRRLDYNLLPEALQTNAINYTKRMNHFFAGLFSLFLIVSIVTPFWLQNQILEELDTKINTAKKRASEVDKIQAEIDAGLELANKAQDLKEKMPVMLNIILELTQLLPEKAWLKSFEYSTDKIQLQGSAISASSLINLLESSEHFSKTSFVSPITQDKTTGVDQFQLETHIKINESIQ